MKPENMNQAEWDRLTEPLVGIPSGKAKKLTPEEQKRDDEFVKAALARAKEKNHEQ